MIPNPQKITVPHPSHKLATLFLVITMIPVYIRQQEERCSQNPSCQDTSRHYASTDFLHTTIDLQKPTLT